MTRWLPLLSSLVVVCPAAAWLVACSSDSTGTAGDGRGDATDATAPDTTAADADVALGPDTVDATDTATPDEDTAVADTTEPDDVPTDTTHVIPPPNIQPDITLCSPAGGDRNIYDLQNPDCADHFNPEPVGQPGQYIELTGVVVTGTFGDTWFVQDPRSGPYSGLLVFNHGDQIGDVEVGDVTDVTGNFFEYFEMSEVYLQTATVKGTMAVPAPYVPADPSHLATNGPLAEMFEGVLVEVDDVATTNTKPDCPLDYGEFTVNGDLRVDDLANDPTDPAPFKWTAHLGDHFSKVVGPLNYSFGNSKIEPRDAADIVATAVGATGNTTKCIASECQAQPTDPMTKQVIVNELIPDPMGQDTNQEWIELYNPGSSAVDVNGWQLRDCGSLAQTLTGADLSIPAHGYLVVGNDSNANLNGGAPVDLAYGDGYYLPNTIGAVLLYDGPGTSAHLVDQIRYSRFDPWTVLQAGHSLERKSPTNDGTVPGSWQTGSKAYGTNGNFGTPGKKNTGS